MNFALDLGVGTDAGCLWGFCSVAEHSELLWPREIGGCLSDLVVPLITTTITTKPACGKRRLEGDPMPDKKTVVTLRSLAERVGLAPCSVSAILNNTAAALSIPKHTKDRVFRAAEEMNYRPNLSARSLRTKRTYMVAVVSGDLGRAPVARLVSGMEVHLRRRGYLLVVAGFGCAEEWRNLSVELLQRGMDGVMAVGMSLPREMGLPAVSVDLGAMDMLEPLTDEIRGWLAELGQSAVDAVLEKIETKGVSGRSRIAAKVPVLYFGLPGVGLEADGASAAFD